MSREQDRQQIQDWMAGPGGWVLLVAAAVFVIYFVWNAVF